MDKIPAEHLGRERERLKAEGFCTCGMGEAMLKHPDALGRVLCSMCQKPVSFLGYPMYVVGEVVIDVEKTP